MPPLAVGDRAANGYWGTCVLLAILGTALATLVAAYFYLGRGLAPVPPGREPPRAAPRDPGERPRGTLTAPRPGRRPVE